MDSPPGFLTNMITDLTPNAPDSAAGISGVGDILGIILNVLIGVGIAGTTIFLIIAGIQYILSKGDPKARQTAQRALTYTITALIITVAAFTFKVALLNLLGVSDADLVQTRPSF